MQRLIRGVYLMHKNGVINIFKNSKKLFYNQFYNIQIIHRDLKPDNLMFGEQQNFQTLKIVDFGLATQTNVET